MNPSIAFKTLIKGLDIGLFGYEEGGILFTNEQEAADLLLINLLNFE